MDELNGVWSSEASGLYYTSFESETLAFASDGSGWCQFARPGYTEIIYFTWKWISNGRVAVDYREGREIAGSAARQSDFENLPTWIGVQMGEEDTPLGGRRLLLRIEPPIMFSREFGLRTRDVYSVRPEES
jgi:hypothetical protein